MPKGKKKIFNEKDRNKLLKEVFCAVVTEDVLFIDEKTGRIAIGGEYLTENELVILKNEANELKKTRLWGVFTNTLVSMAHRTMFESSTSYEDMKSGKMLLVAVDLLKRLVARLENIHFANEVPNVVKYASGQKSSVESKINQMTVVTKKKNL
jgi:hypothetical protein